MNWLAVLFGLIVLLGCGAEQSPPPPPTDHFLQSENRPQRIVSLDYCADQYLLKLADRDQILAVSPDAGKDFSYMREAAAGLGVERPVAENILILKPDLIVRSYGGGANAAAFFERAGIPVLQLGWVSNIDHEQTGSIPSLIEHVAQGLGQPDRGKALITEFRERLAALQPSDGNNNSKKTAFYMTPGGATTGPGSLIHEMMKLAGFENFQKRPGWHALPLERLVYEQPDLIATAFIEMHANHPHPWSAFNHPIARKLLADHPVAPLQGAWTACGGWFILEAVAVLAETAAQ